MRKLSMKLEDLEIETFATDPAAEERGTVLGREASDTADETCSPETFASCDPYASDCHYTCGRSCWGSCWECGE